ncbi:hypothetical protein BABINDRAFT_160920 [Babjeviella inositovora NRRL Y-12698]|uniref:Uncharacterized protein n=1 Tax=Babjeviella inositovora NRRL Y-12698 TaxID=984486 RepID=A0A1E3QT53_9ASCO|nr:uncharacterized protein BABINDRAFT_160920 [Babjeviella inositovora NRRL Y-12698]ODQ80684.1 hypothetical protein BABINDRAFT_160920 [Babjeviella inositovora NRRL Y-12698]
MSASLKRPVQIQEFILAVLELADFEIYNIRSQLTRSITKLHESNTVMAREVGLIKARIDDDNDDETPSAELTEDLHLYQESIQENGIVLKNQEERIGCLDNELTARGLSLDGSTVDAREGVPVTVPLPKAVAAAPDTDNTSVYL